MKTINASDAAIAVSKAYASQELPLTNDEFAILIGAITEYFRTLSCLKSKPSLLAWTDLILHWEIIKSLQEKINAARNKI